MGVLGKWAKVGGALSLTVCTQVVTFMWTICLPCMRVASLLTPVHLQTHSSFVCRTLPGRARLHTHTHANNPPCTLPMTVVNMTVIRTLIQMLRMFVLAGQGMLFTAWRK